MVFISYPALQKHQLKEHTGHPDCLAPQHFLDCLVYQCDLPGCALKGFPAGTWDELMIHREAYFANGGGAQPENLIYYCHFERCDKYFRNLKARRKHVRQTHHGHPENVLYQIPLLALDVLVQLTVEELANFLGPEVDLHEHDEQREFAAIDQAIAQAEFEAQAALAEQGHLIATQSANQCELGRQRAAISQAGNREVVRLPPAGVAQQEVVGTGQLQASQRWASIDRSIKQEFEESQAADKATEQDWHRYVAELTDPNSAKQLWEIRPPTGMLNTLGYFRGTAETGPLRWDSEEREIKVEPLGIVQAFEEGGPPYHDQEDDIEQILVVDDHARGYCNQPNLYFEPGNPWCDEPPINPCRLSEEFRREGDDLYQPCKDAHGRDMCRKRVIRFSDHCNF